MAQKNSLEIAKYKLLCDHDGVKFVSKSGAAYIAALAQVFALNNQNDTPFTIDQIKTQPKLKDFNFEGVKEFKYVCDLEATPLEIQNDIRKNEKIIASNFQGDLKEVFDKSLGVAYILTCVVGNDEHIIKIGCSRTTFKARLGSYNCGTVNNWRTASTTNIKILQSFVTTRSKFKLYLYDCSEEVVQVTWHGVQSVPFASPKMYAVEDILVKKFQEIFKTKPLANVQVNATEA
jgi:hypothetical protein